MPDRPRFSRFRRLPGLYRFGDDKPPDPADEPQLVSLYLPAGLLDRAEVQGLRAGHESTQAYCTELLRAAILAEERRAREEAESARASTLESLDELANDPDYVAALADRAQEPAREDRANRDEKGVPLLPGDHANRSLVLMHADRDSRSEARGFLATLRRGEPIEGALVDGLLVALGGLESSLRQATTLDRALAYALHRLAFEGQVLLTDGPSSSADPETILRVRRVQEAVDRVLSGEDIRYFPGDGQDGEGAP